jgi:hypothetical protein
MVTIANVHHFSVSYFAALFIVQCTFVLVSTFIIIPPIAEGSLQVHSHR